MLPNTIEDPEAFAAALERLASALRSDPRILTTHEDLTLQTLARVERRVSDWAEERGVPLVCIPERPVPSELTLARTLLFLDDLAAVVRYIAANSSLAGNMRSVVVRLVVRRDRATAELEELESALEELCENFGYVEDALKEIQGVTGDLAHNGHATTTLSQLHHAAGSVHGALVELVRNLREIHTRVKGWLGKPANAN
jgi:hypothetical protein